MTNARAANENGRPFVGHSQNRVVVYAGTAAYALLFLFAAIVHFAVFKEARFDLGNMVQSIWSTLHGHVLQSTTASGQQRIRLGYHVDPFLLLLVPLFWIWSSPLLLLVVQVLAVASGALPVFWLARKHLGSLNRVQRVVKLTAALATEGDFTAHPKVVDAASELLRDVFGEDSLPVRVIYGVASLPLGLAIELEVILEVTD